MLFAATNEVPEQGELAALKDRFCLKAESRSVQEDHFTELIDAGVQGEVYKSLNQKPWVEGHCIARRPAQGQPLPDAPVRPQAPQRPRRGAERPRGVLPRRGVRRVPALVKTLVREDKIFISDRKLVKLYKLFRVRAWLFTGGTVSRDDLRLLAYLGETHQEIELLREKVPMLLGLE